MTILKPSHKSRGGIHPAYHKDLSRNKPIVEMPLPSLLRVSMSQHLGAPAKPLVKKGDTVLRGQRIGDPAGFISACVHAPTSGTVKAVAEATTVSGASALSVDIEPDGRDQWVSDLKPTPQWMDLDSKSLVALVAQAGIAGMGGAGFPTHVKLSPPPEKQIDTLIINGAECEPFLTADHRLMLEQSEQIAVGVAIVQKILNAKNVYVAIEDNKPEALDAMAKALTLTQTQSQAKLVALKTEYPQGAEKQQIYAITGKEVPSGGLPMDVGTVVENVGTMWAIWDAVVNGRPLTERITTVTGFPVKNPSNVRARIGTVYSDLLNFCGGASGPIGKIISGGPMMGIAQPELETATTKTTSGILLLSPPEVRNFTSMPCISCGRCVEACPAGLMPSELSQRLEAEDFDGAEEYNVLDCIECGCCAFVCPARRPLVQHMRRGKGQVMLNRREAQEKASGKSG